MVALAIRKIVELKAGNGGLGKISFTRNVRSGLLTVPNGGNGGDGGDIKVRKSQLSFGISDLDVTYTASNGFSGIVGGQRGKKGDSVTVLIPENAFIFASGCQISDSVFLKGGRGRLGNMFTKYPNKETSKNHGESMSVTIEMRRFAHVILAGPPNSGKSSLLNALCRTNYKVAPYPGSTEVPNYGVLKTQKPTREPISLVEIPGLIDYHSLVIYKEAILKTDIIAIVSCDATFQEHSHYESIFRILHPKCATVRILTKSDHLVEPIEQDDSFFAVSALSKDGLQALEERIISTATLTERNLLYEHA